MSERRFALLEQQVDGLNKMMTVVHKFMELVDAHIDRIDVTMSRIEAISTLRATKTIPVTLGRVMTVDDGPLYTPETKKKPPPVKARARDCAGLLAAGSHRGSPCQYCDFVMP